MRKKRHYAGLLKTSITGFMTPGELIMVLYNIVIVLLVMVFFPVVDDGLKYIFLHLAGLAGFFGLIGIRNKYQGFWRLVLLLLPVIVSGSLHYETGLLNRLIIVEFQDAAIVRLDEMIFGCQLYLVLSRLVNSEFIAQLLHLAYFSFYALLSVPLLVLYIQQQNDSGAIDKADRMLSGILFTMLICYLIFLVYPVAGPTAFHDELFPNPRAMVKLMNFFYRIGDLDGGAVPSSHVAVALTAVLYLVRYFPRWRWFFWIDVVLLTIATVYNSYHYASDVLGGLVTGMVLFTLGKKYYQWFFKPASG